MILDTPSEYESNMQGILNASRYYWQRKPTERGGAMVIQLWRLRKSKVMLRV